MNFTICQLFLAILMFLSSAVVCQKQSMNQNVTEYDGSFQKVLSRRKRFLVWRPGSNVLLTASLVKPLGFRRPTGQNLILEWDLFYPLPSTWHQPEATLRPPTTTTEKSIEPVDSWTRPAEIWQPDGGWTNDVIAKINEDNQKASRRVENIAHRKWNEGNLFRPPVSIKWNPMLDRQKIPWLQSTTSQLNRNDLNFNQPLPSQQPQHSSSSLYSSDFMAFDNKQSILPPRHSLDDVNENWKHFRAHRERRDLYERIQYASPLNSKYVRSCLLRTMCEVQHFLKPRGYSLLHDMLRTIFTIPIKDEMNDDYSSAMRANVEDCDELYRENCPDEKEVRRWDMLAFEKDI